MRLHHTILNQILKTQNIFELVALCYQILDKSEKKQVDFISQYLDQSVTIKKDGTVIRHPEKENPNLSLLEFFSEEVIELFHDYPVITYESQKQNLVEKIKAINLRPFKESKRNKLTIVYTLLSAIDCVASEWDITRVSETLGPLNQSSEYWVYFRPRKTIHSDLIAKMGRERKARSGFSDCIHNFFVIKKSQIAELAGIPEIVYIPHEREEQYHLKIAVIAGMCGKGFTGKNDCGSRFTIKYYEEQQENLGKIILNVMEQSIRQGAEFVILPEYVVSPMILAQIKSTLAEWKHNNFIPDSSLIAVFAGSSWTDEDDNVQYILDAWGNEIGKYYKYSPYTHKSKGAGTYDSSEGLEHPGKICNLISIEDIGCFLPAICRDVIDEHYTTELVKNYLPTFVMTSAWSASGKSFISHFKKYAEHYFTNSVFCNGCGALNKGTIMGGATQVYKEGTVVSGKFIPIKKDKGCKSCEKEGCYYMVEFDFTPEHIEKKKAVIKKLAHE